ncbi:LOW QUALITY PROTEIN: Hypothetical protein PHPALM_5915 [Phytophthora palmivora]|uniref:PiggyBac transposable element-derived protein domain-containing protein n=1 Tax=Phytophthora palmivora TaxID=4796 RepID=A0A2P4YG80_9STRA|nr:LOW QUALITY PROTEIN: Hypothetical protein PHPALM_5915 [Phytophthora palmivora]
MEQKRSSRRRNPVAQAATAHDVAFRHLWRQLRAAGWKSKRPTGRQTEWSYTTPDASSVFVAESAVVEYAFQSGLLVADNREEASVNSGEEGQVPEGDVKDAERELVVDKHMSRRKRVTLACELLMTLSQINTSIELSQNTLEQFLASPSEPEVKLSQSAVTSAFDLSPTDLKDNAAAGVPAAATTQSAPQSLRAQTSSLYKDDVNVLHEGERSSHYESYSSGASDDNGIDEDESNPGVDFAADDDDILSDSDAVEIDKAYLSSLQIGSCDLIRAALKARSRQALEATSTALLEGWSLPAVFAFDEGVLPATLRRNITRMFMSDKPHCYGSKLYMLYDAKTAYYHRFGVCEGKRRGADDSGNEVDYKTGAAAVVRNLKVVMTTERRHPWHAVVIDRYYSSVLFAIELLSMNNYVVGTIATNRLGFDQIIKSKKKTRPASVPRGSFSFSRSVDIPSMKACIWRYRKPGYYLCTGSVAKPSMIER